MLSNLKHLAYVVAAAEHGSITAAAQATGVSQATVSAAINNVEDHFRLRIFQRRTARGISLTPSGQKFVARAMRLLAEADMFETEAAGLSSRLSGSLEVGCFLPAAPFVMPRVIKAMSFQYPAITINLREGSAADILQDLKGGRIDVSLVYDFNLDNHVEFEPLISIGHYVLLPHGDPLAEHKTISLADLVDRPMILLDLPASPERFLQIFHVHNLTPRIGFRTPNHEMVRSMVAAGLGYSILGFRPAVDRAIDGTPLVCRAIREDKLVERFGLAYDSQLIKTRVVEAFAGECRKLFKDPQTVANIIFL